MADRVNSLLAELRGCGETWTCGDCKRGNSPEMCQSLVLDAADVIQEYVDRCKRYADEIMMLREQPRWISVTERLPAHGARVLAAAEGVWVAEAYRDASGMWMRSYGAPWNLSVTAPVTHWMPLPDGPEAPHDDT